LKDLELKLGGIINEYKALSFKVFTKDVCVL
jgi:hypothetical protein